jgi:hypothetical protein
VHNVDKTEIRSPTSPRYKVSNDDLPPVNLFTTANPLRFRGSDRNESKCVPGDTDTSKMAGLRQCEVCLCESGCDDVALSDTWIFGALILTHMTACQEINMELLS